MRLLNRQREYLRPVPFQEEAMTIRPAPGLKEWIRHRAGDKAVLKGEAKNVKYLT